MIITSQSMFFKYSLITVLHLPPAGALSLKWQLGTQYFKMLVLATGKPRQWPLGLTVLQSICKRRVALLKKEAVHILCFHYLPHRLELAVRLQCFHLIWKMYHYSPKLVCTLKSIAEELNVNIRKPFHV